MSQVIADELSRLDTAFSGNRLLSTFAPEARAMVEPDCDIVELSQGEVLFKPGEAVRHSVFPFGQTMVGLTIEVDADRSVEVASIGREGAAGGIISQGHAPAFAAAVTLIPGPALRLPLAALDEAKSRSPFINHIFSRYADYLLAMVMQSSACNAFHAIPARAARWLLTAQDRAGDRIELTQEAFAALLGVQRTTVNAIVRGLQDEGLISNRRGVIQVVDRAGLVRRSCGCYQAVESHFTQVIGLNGSGGSGER